MTKNTFRLLGLLVIAIIWLPTGPSDFFIIPTIIKAIGFQMYVLISILMVWYLYKTIEGRTLGDKLHNVTREIKGVIS